MSTAPDSAKDEEEHEADTQATSMRAQLSKEVASWNKERRRQSDDTIAVPRQPDPERASRRSSSDPKKAPPAPPANTPASKPDGARSRPFGMSYGGMTQAEYTQYLLDQKSR